MKFYIVGSALSKEEPRDIDICGVMEDWHFKSVFDLTVEELSRTKRLGNGKWRLENLGAIRILQYVFPELVPIDFKFMPKSLLYEPYKEIDITLSPEKWGIGFPNLENHGVIE